MITENSESPYKPLRNVKASEPDTKDRSHNTIKYSLTV